MSKKKFRAVCFVNQFFGQIGGEDTAHVGFSVSEKPIGPAMLFDSKLGDEGDVVATIVCGDNFFAENIADATKEGVELVSQYSPDIFFAGPAFNAGRYGMSCGNMVKGVADKLNIPTLTGMYHENPAVEIFRKNTIIVEAKILSSDMKNVVPKMTGIGLRILKGEPVGSAKDEGYIKRDIILNERQEKNAAQRAVEMLLAKLKGEEFESELLPPNFDIVEPAQPVADISKVKLALVTDGGLIPEGNPDKLKPNASLVHGEYNFDELVGNKHFVIHSGYDGTWVLENPYRLLPVDVLRELVDEGKIGSLDEDVFVATGNCASVSACKAKGEKIAHKLLDKGVEAAILSST